MATQLTRAIYVSIASGALSFWISSSGAVMSTAHEEGNVGYQATASLRKLETTQDNKQCGWDLNVLHSSSLFCHANM